MGKGWGWVAESFQDKMVASSKVLRLGTRERLRTELGLEWWKVRPPVRVRKMRQASQT